MFMIVMKFGGTSVGNAKRIRNIVAIVKDRLESGPVVVVSALGGVTDDLIQLYNLAINGKKAKAEIDKLVNRHYDTIAELGLSDEIIAGEVKRLAEVIDHIYISGERSAQLQDEFMSLGERMSARIVAGYMASIGLRARAYDAFDVGLITDSNFGDADILPETYQSIRDHFPKDEGIPVITGFIGKGIDGDITTLGRGGSDYTASIIGAAIKASEIQIWTDVNGIMTADPKVVKGARSLEAVSYDEASELALLGAKVLHPKTMLPAIENDIPVRILNTFNPEHRGTVVLREVDGLKNRVASITCKKNMYIINISAPAPIEAGFMPKVFGIFDRRGVVAEMISTSGANMSVTIEGKTDVVTLVKELKGIAAVEVRSNCAKISIVGNGLLYYKPEIPHVLFTSLKGVNAELISPSTSEINQSFVVEEQYAEQTIRKLHRAFFGK